MYKFGKQSMAVYKTLHPSLQVVFSGVLEHRDCSLREGYRDKETQDRYFEEKRTKVRFPDSKHNRFPSEAVDAYPYPITKEQLNDREFWVEWGSWVVGFAAAKGVKLRWGYDWDQDHDLKDQKFNDGPHFELVEE